MDRRDLIKGGIVGLIGAMFASPGRILSASEAKSLEDVSKAAQDLRDFARDNFARGKVIRPSTFTEFSELIIKLVGE